MGAVATPLTKKPSRAQRLVLENLASGLPATHHLSGRSAHGGFTQTRWSLYSNGWITDDGITAAGREAIGLPAQPEPDFSEGAFEMLQAAVNIARGSQTRDLSTLRQHLAHKFPGRETDIEAALAYWAQDVAKRHPNGPPKI